MAIQTDPSAGNVTVTSGSVDITAGSVAISEMPDIGGSVVVTSGSVDITAGSVAISELPDIAGSVVVTSGSMVVTGGSVGVSEMPDIAGSVIVTSGSVTIVGGVDEITEAVITVDFAHHEVHEGDAFVTDAVDTTMACNNTMILAFRTMVASNVRAHMVVDFSTFAGGVVQITEGATWNNESGALNQIYNRKRQAVMNTSGLLEDSGQAAFTATNNVILNPTGVSGGSVIHDIYGFGKKDKVAGAGRDTTEFLLRPDTQYAYVFTSLDDDNAAQITLNWYEHTDSN